MQGSARTIRDTGYQDQLWRGKVACLTAQLNFTYYPAIEEVRWVQTTREPIANHEISRDGGQGAWHWAIPKMTEELSAGIWLVHYLAEVHNREERS